VSEFFRLSDQLRDQPVPAGDLQMARDYMVGSFPLTIETPQQIASQVARVKLLDLPADYLSEYRDRVAEVDGSIIMRVAQDTIRSDRVAVYAMRLVTTSHRPMKH